MFEVSTGWKIGVELADGGGSYIVVSVQQLTGVCRLLTGHGVPHVVDGAVPTRHHDDTPFAMVVQLGFAVEVTHVQDILDFAP
jgi:hypothetical protein